MDVVLSILTLRFTNQGFSDAMSHVFRAPRRRLAERNDRPGDPRPRRKGPPTGTGRQGGLSGEYRYESDSPRFVASSNSPFLAPSRKHSHSFRSNTRIRPSRSPATRISTQSPLAHHWLSGKATSIEPSPSPDRAQASAAGSMPSSSGVGLMTSSLVRAFSQPRSRASGSRRCRPSARPRHPTGRCT